MSSKKNIKPFKVSSQNKSKVEINKENRFRENLSSVLSALNLIPGILFTSVNIIKSNKQGLVPVAIFAKALINNRPRSIEPHIATRFDDRSRSFLSEFVKIFLQTYDRTSNIDKVLVLLTFIDIITNEIPNIIREANKIKYIEPSKIFAKLIINAREVGKDYT